MFKVLNQQWHLSSIERIKLFTVGEILSLCLNVIKNAKFNRTVDIVNIVLRFFHNYPREGVIIE